MSVGTSKMPKGNLFDHAAAIGSGAPLDYKVKVQHRSDILMEEQIQTVKNVQDALEHAVAQLEQSRSEDEFKFYSRQANDLKQKNDEMMLVLKVVHKINTELSYARLELQKALKTNGDVNLARKRVGWLEDRMEKLLGRKRQKSPARAQMRSALMLDDPRLMMYARDSRGSGDALGMRPGDEFYTDTSVGETPRMIPYGQGMPEFHSHRELETNEMTPQPSDYLGTPGETEEQESQDIWLHTEEELDTESEAGTFGEMQTPILKEKQGQQSEIEPLRPDFTPSTQASSPPSDVYITAHLPTQEEASEQSDDQVVHEAQDGDENDGRQSMGKCIGTSHSSSLSEESEKDVMKSKPVSVSKVQSGGIHQSKGSRVTLKSPTTELSGVVSDRKETPVDYWESEHHRFEHSEYAPMLCQLNALSYHQMGLAVPGTFVEEVEGEPFLPWRPKRKGSDVTDIHKLELDRLERRVHSMYEKVSRAAMLSVNTEPTRGTGAALLSNFDRLTQRPMSDGPKPKIRVDLTTKEKKKKMTSQPTMAKFVSMEKINGQDMVSFPPLDKARLGSSMSGRLIYYPNPLPYPEKLPITQTNRDKEYPRNSDTFVSQEIGIAGPADRIANQRNLFNETKFTSSLYRSKPSRRSPTTSERRFRRMLLGGTPSSATSEQVKPSDKLKATFQTAKTMMRLKGGSNWKMMKPKLGALQHSGLKWERVKSIVHDSLTSPHAEERVDAARQLGHLKCGDTMVMFALKERLRQDDSDRVQYEAAKSLILLGCWEEEVVANLVKFMLNGNSDIIADVLKTLINGKNVQYVDKRIPSFPDLSQILSELCQFGDVTDNISLDAAVALGKLCVADENAKSKLRQVLSESGSTHVKAQALEILVRQLNYRGWDMVEALLEQLKCSPVWKYRKNAAKLLILLGKKHVCLDNKVESVYELLDKRLWDDPNKNVRQEVARAMASLDMFARACEHSERRLEDPLEDVRAQAVICLGTLGMKNERIIRVLLEMLELDSSEYVRLMIIRTLAILNTQDRRVLRVLRDKERGEGPLAREAKRALDSLGAVGPPPNTGKKSS